MANVPLLMFLVFIAITLGITYWASKRSSGSSAYFAASRQIKGWQNGIAVAGDYMSAASFLGIAGIIAFQGYDGFLFSVGWLVAYLTVLLVIAEPLRNAGKYCSPGMLPCKERFSSKTPSTCVVGKPMAVLVQFCRRRPEARTIRRNALKGVNW